jgi:hypothetical protein
MAKKILFSLSLLLAWASVRAEAAPKSSPQGSQETRISAGQFKRNQLHSNNGK